MKTPTESTERLDARAETDAAGPSDVELVSDVRAGQEAAFEELFRRHRRRVAFIAGRFFRRREQIEEVVQESFAKAFFALGEFSNRQAESFGAWLSRIAFNVCYDELRRLKRRPESSLSELDEDEAAWLRERARSASEARGVESQAVSRELAAKLVASGSAPKTGSSSSCSTLRGSRPSRFRRCWAGRSRRSKLGRTARARTCGACSRDSCNRGAGARGS